MGTLLAIDVTSLDAAHRSALEEVIGVQLESNQQLIIQVTERDAENEKPMVRRPQTIEGLPSIYEGLSDEQAESLERDINTRANLTRNLP